ncbi:MAG TPA: Smr/MutS family protein, partial [Draconibacterium sp.]|nr:Smr/MutS family protein [Draconibacterium sp.]
VVIDLHITELLDDSEGLSNREMLEIQMEAVESEMNLAIKNHAKRIVFIHGVGQGVLKQEVTNLLKRNFKKYYFQDASFKEYGYGATMVILRKG